MRSSFLLIFSLVMALPAPAAKVDKAAGDVAARIDELSIRLFLHDADTAYADKNYSEARTKFRWLADRGNPEARLVLGIMHEESQGVSRDYEKAFNWYLKAARQGFAPAQLRLARMYYFGRHVRQDNFLAYVWLSVAALQGDETARQNRDKLVKLMDSEEASSAKMLAREWAGKYNTQ